MLQEIVLLRLVAILSMSKNVLGLSMKACATSKVLVVTVLYQPQKANKPVCLYQLCCLSWHFVFLSFSIVVIHASFTNRLEPDLI